TCVQAWWHRELNPGQLLHACCEYVYRKPIAHVGGGIFVGNEERSRQHGKTQSVTGKCLAISIHGMRQRADDLFVRTHELLLFTTPLPEYHNAQAPKPQDRP